MSDFYVLHDGDDWFYYLDGYREQTFYADGVAMRPAEEANWWVTDHEAETIEREYPDSRKLIGWKLIANVVPTEEYPATLTPEEHGSRWDFGDGDSKVGALYEGVYEDVPAYRERVEGPFKVLGGAPAPKDGLTWEASLPFVLRYATQYRHLFPGRLVGFWAALRERLEQLPGVSAYDHSDFSVYVKVKYEKPVPGRNLSNRRTTFHESTQTVPMRPPRHIEGRNRAEAKAEWERQMEALVDEVAYWTEVRLCSHCKGTGVLDPKRVKVAS